MHPRLPLPFTLLATLILPTSLTTSLLAQTFPTAPGTHLAGLLANDARDILRNPDLPAHDAATQAAILLEYAAQLDPADLRTLHLLAQTAQAAGRTPAQRTALRQIIAADPGDLVAQTQYIDLLAATSQTAEDRMGTYRGALAQSDLDPQVRSEVALRLARLAEGRGDTAACRDFLTQSVRLNDVNVSALRDLVRLAAAEPPGTEAFTRHLQALSALLVANPYQPDAWLQVARICSTANAHDRAAEFLETAMEQFSIDGTPVTLDLYLELALETALAGQRPQAYNIASNLSQIPDAPLALLLVAELLAPYAPASPISATTQSATQPFERLPEIRKRLAELAKDAANPASLADAAGADLTILSTPGTDTAAWIDAYAKMVQPNDPTLARLQGWLLYRQHKLPEAQAALKDSTDPLAQVALARILIDQGHPDAAAPILQELWNANPSGLLALQIALAAAPSRIQLADSAGAKMIRPLIARLTPGLSGMHRQPRESQLILVSYRKAAVGPSEAVPLQIRITNTTDRAVPVGADGVIKTTLGLAAATRGAASVPVGLYAIEDLQRTYRLEAHQMIEATVRVDQGRLADLLEQDPSGTYAVNVTLLTAPRVLSPTEFSTGTGGQAIAVGDFQRGGIPSTTPADLQKLAAEIAGLNGDRQLVRIEAASAILAQKDDPGLSAALITLARSPDPIIRDVLLRSTSIRASGDLLQALAPCATDADPLIRLLWANLQARIASHGGGGVTAALDNLEKMKSAEKDALVKDFLSSALTSARAATKPADLLPVPTPASTNP